MGDVAISALVKDVLGRLTSVAIQEFSLLWGFKDDVLTLKDDFDQIRVVLQDAEEKHKEKPADLWLKSLISASLEVENVLDEILIEAMLQRLHKDRGIKHRVSAFFSSNHNQLMFRVRIAHKVKGIRRKLDAIKSKRLDLSLTPSATSHDVDSDVVREMPNRETSSLIHDSSIIFGRNEEIEMITGKICDKDIGKYDNGEIRVYGIWGMGGVGKTTLTQLVYNHERVDKYFELKCWVHVSEKFQVKEIIKRIIESTDKSECTLLQLDMLQDSVQNKLRGKKFLIVFDDVWIEDDEKAKWEQLSTTLSCGAEGSIVVMTTRSNTTSRMMSKVRELQHELGCLSEEDSWQLFKKFAFAQGREGDDISRLEPIGREKIVAKCKGLPLAVKTLGSLLWSKNSESDWLRVKDSNIWELQDHNILPALKLSYDNLPSHLKRCLAYCCLFPKGQEMEKDTMIQLWVSNGFIPPRGEISLYVLGEESFSCLVWRSFFQVVTDHRYKMHDLMHDMVRHVMRHDCLVIETGKEVVIPNNVLHMSLSCPDFLLSPQNLRKLALLRSIFMNGEMNESTISQIFNHTCIRVLYLCGIGLRTLPESICKLKYLKYLNLSYLVIEVLPDSVIYLQNLQVLLLCFCLRLRKLPEGLRYMTNLQRLDIISCSSLLYLPIGIKELTSLRMLPLFPICCTSGAKVRELGDLNLLEGELEISGLEDVGGFIEAKSADLKSKRNLSVLGLNWSNKYYIRKPEPRMFASDKEILEGLEPNACLKGLKISHYMGDIISSSWMVNLMNLAEISFYHCDNCEHIPQLGRLPNLRVINLRDMDSFKCFLDDDKNMSVDTNNMFPCLQELNIVKCPNLVSLPSILPKLKVLRLVECDRLLSLPDGIQSFEDLNRLVIFRCECLSKRCEKQRGVDWPKISHIPNISTEYPW